MRVIFMKDKENIVPYFIPWRILNMKKRGAANFVVTWNPDKDDDCNAAGDTNRERDKICDATARGWFYARDSRS
jgi:hypothetical protein